MVDREGAETYEAYQRSYVQPVLDSSFLPFYVMPIHFTKIMHVHVSSQ